MASVTLRIKCQKGTNIRLEAGGSMLLRDFVEKLESLTDVPASAMALLKGFPPKRIAFDLETGTVKDLGFQTQDTLIVELDKNVGAAGAVPTTSVQSRIKVEASGSTSPDESSKGSNAKKPRSTSSFNSTTSSESTVVPQLPTSNNLPPYFVKAETPSSVPYPRVAPILPANDGLSEVPLASVRSNSNIHNELLEQDVITIDDDSAPGILMRHVVPADNSCLFRSVAFCLSDVIGEVQDVNTLRQLIAATVASDPAKYNEAFLGKPNPDYCSWIQHSDSWGGGIEVSILAEFYGYEITVVTIQSTNVSRFGEDRNYTQRIFLLYDGIHYDPLYMEMFHLAQQRKIFSTGDAETLEKAEQLAREAKLAHQYVDIKNFQLRCNRCNKLLKGNTEAQQHAKSTGHIDFSETT